MAHFHPPQFSQKHMQPLGQQRPMSESARHELVPARTTGHTAEGTYLQGLVVPTVRPVLAAASAVKELERPVGVTKLQAPRRVQAHQADAALDHVQ